MLPINTNKNRLVFKKQTIVSDEAFLFKFEEEKTYKQANKQTEKLKNKNKTVSDEICLFLFTPTQRAN